MYAAWAGNARVLPWKGTAFSRAESDSIRIKSATRRSETEKVANACATVEERRFQRRVSSLKSMSALALVLWKWTLNEFFRSLFQPRRGRHSSASELQFDRISCFPSSFLSHARLTAPLKLCPFKSSILFSRREGQNSVSATT